MEPLVLTISEAAGLLGVGRSKMFEMLAAGQVPVVRFGRVVRIPRRELEELLHRQAEESLTASLDISEPVASLWRRR
jgi:excisionase family DNA binding protein